MKLNIGCGNQYQKGFINIDAYNKSVADITTNLENLEYESNSVEHIQAKQLIEHLGYFKTIYSIAEWFRILKPKATILIETPDLEESFKQFLNGDYEVKRNIITWIYGHESKGMTHVFCFPKDLLEHILKKTGFKIIKKEYYGKKNNQPTFRIICEKPKKYEKYQAISNFRKKILNKKILNFQNIYTTIQQEKLIDFFIKEIKKINKKNQTKTLEKIIIKGGIHSPKITKILINELLNYKIIDKKISRKYLETLEYLIKNDYPSVLLTIFKQTDIIPGDQNKNYQSIELIGKKSIIKLLDSTSTNREKIKKYILEIKMDKNFDKIDFFSDETIQRKADEIFWKSIKKFNEKKYSKANSLLNNSIKIYRNNLFYFWNKARLEKLLGKNDIAEKNYQNTVKLINKLNHDKKQELKNKIDKEFKNKTEKYSEPIVFYEVIND